ncbi:GntR family transcriptional regulator [Sedimentibacter sp. zth1]|uniref:GntR family transcriptional regulator n=1 Tax=Sedimentibacter sp. zth1 TaxID=2816908 RepID=UPI001A9369DA|nr:GntR family transcriptional regulator [Sedimentibacter sp. zth1]QSX06484.1 GntR family transcriptional regulator [Sedimentibacter sp. zth1]
MNLNFESKKPIFLQISEQIEDAIFVGTFPEETQIPSTTEISTTFKINPATVLKGMNVLVDNNIIYKRRGVGMFVCSSAVDTIRKSRENNFYDNYIVKLVEEAKKLKLSKEDIISFIERGYTDEYRN